MRGERMSLSRFSFLSRLPGCRGIAYPVRLLNRTRNDILHTDRINQPASFS